MSIGQAARFDRDTAVRPLGEGRYAVRFDAGWWAPAGPNGGYVAALVLRAILAELDQGAPSAATRPGEAGPPAVSPARGPRSLTLHYLAPPVAGEGIVEVRSEREGRSLSTLSARVVQDDRVVTLALCACSAEREAALDYADPAPVVPPPEAVDRVPPVVDAVPLSRQMEMRPALGAPAFSGAEEALTGGWLRLAEPTEVDAPVLALYADAWWPAPFARLTAPSAAPTIDLTIHFRRRPDPDPEQHVLVKLRSGTSHEGFFEEDVELWSRDGELLVQARQLALLLPPR